MLFNAVKIWLHALKQGGTWTTLVWMAVFSLISFLLFALVGGSALIGAMLHSGSPSAPITPNSSITHFAAGVLAVYLIMFIATPFLTGGIYGIYALEVQGEQTSWGTFWKMGKKLYGRGWGLIGYVILYLLVIGIFAAIVIFTLHIPGIILAIAVFILTLPWGLRMTGGLFVDQNTWGTSFRNSFRKAYYWQLLIGMFIGVLGYLLVLFLDMVLTHALGFVGIALYLILELAFAVVVPLWLFALYAATKSPKPS